MNRRHFVMATTAAVAATAKSSMLRSPNDTVRVACVGVRGQGNSHLKEYAAMKNVEIAAICDIDESVLERRLTETEQKTGKRPAGFWELRRVLEDKSIDAISLATPNHSHTLQTIWSLEAGKHVYCEKPCSHDMFETRQLLAAAKKYDRQIIQHGTNSRSNPAVIEAVGHMREGLLGDVYHARGLCFKWRDTIGRAAPEAVPAGVHYDQWLGPAPESAFTRNRFHYNWHWFWDYGNGDLGNQGIHEMDIARWGLGVTYPVKVSAIGGHFMFDDDQQTPNTVTLAYEFRDGGKPKLLTYEVRHWMTNYEDQIGTHRKSDTGSIGNLFYGSKGVLAVEWYDRYWTWMGKDKQPGPARQATASNWQNFIDAVRSGNPADRRAPIEEGAISSALVHLGNISYRVGRTVHFDADKWECTGDAEATALFRRQYRAPYVVPDLSTT